MRRASLICAALALLVAGCGDNERAGTPLEPDAAVDPFCGDGIVNLGEDCDDVNSVSGDGCETDCRFTCVATSQCDDGDACTGVESCGADHRCVAGTPLGEGAMCGSGRICRAGVCSDASCGDAVVTAPEECDDSSSTPGDGCDACRFSCLSTDSTRNCTPADACAGQGTCNDTTHVCSAGTPIMNGLACPGNPAGTCQNGRCVTALCRNGVMEAGEACDDGNSTEGDGCDNDCTFSCATPASDCAAPPACQQQTCTAAHVCLAVPNPALNGMSCGGANICQNGACLPPTSTCGNGTRETGEDCDLGAGNGPNTGCETTCRFSCSTGPDSCPDANVCNGVEACTMTTVSGQMVRRCVAGASPPAGSSCGGTNICLGMMCRPSLCGDTFIDRPRGEECEPPGSASCDALCHNIVCGNGRRDGPEQCDDGNLTNLDGCDGRCRFEQDARATYLVMQFATDTFCTANRLGAAITGGTARNQLQTSLTDGVRMGTINILMRLLDLDDLSGQNDAALTLGVLDGAAVAGTGYNGTSDLDWWYTVNAAAIDAQRMPLATLAGSITNRVLAAGPGNVTLRVRLAGQPAALRLTSTRLTVNLGAVSTPRTSVGAVPPGHLPSENLLPTLMSFATAGQQTATGSGRLCGDVTAESLRQVPIPTALTGCGLFNCSQCYTTANNLLDVIVGGCNLLGTQITPTQPDRDDPTVAALGAGPPYSFVWTASSSSVTGCRDRNNAAVNLSMCMLDAAYSSFFRFAADRVIIR